MRTRLGAMLDPLTDKVLIVSAVILLSLKNSSVSGLETARLVVVVAVIGKDLWVVLGFIVLLMATGHYRIQPSITGKAATVVQLALVIAVLLGPDLNRSFGRRRHDSRQEPLVGCRSPFSPGHNQLH